MAQVACQPGPPAKAGWSIERGELTPTELRFAIEQEAGRYGAAEWTAKR
jgi:hypothetical protein